MDLSFSLLLTAVYLAVQLVYCEANGQFSNDRQLASSMQGRAYGSNSSIPACGLPSVMASSIPTDRERMVGVWYQYMKKDNLPLTLNKVLENTIVERTYYPGTSISAVMTDQKITITNRDASAACIGRFNLIVGRVDGIATYYRVQTDRTTNPTIHQLYQLYLDPSSEGMAIQYECAKPNFGTGVCDVPYVYVDVRINPNQLSAAQKEAKNKIINDTLKPYCLSITDLQEQTFDNNLSACQPPRPEIYSNMIAGFKASLPMRT
ncbi:hypothetical protein RvY_13288 [Ramazzottius varieornatus]|uniref:Lipocalin/cytosolic fatty-acid binding domain-containing protein n=1 Tax=Ramazzottius varieornatus TaxID=947166 RepID=A0A1D1VMC0_RAMVA|nr:hypothetical protein RvY_13288 [Ramazzottius varieornatus]